MATDAPDKILRIKTVLERSGLSRSALYPKTQDGTFPPNVKIGTRCAGWRESALTEWQTNPPLLSLGRERRARHSQASVARVHEIGTPFDSLAARAAIRLKAEGRPE